MPGRGGSDMSPLGGPPPECGGYGGLRAVGDDGAPPLSEVPPPGDAAGGVDFLPSGLMVAIVYNPPDAAPVIKWISILIAAAATVGVVRLITEPLSLIVCLRWLAGGPVAELNAAV
ncbi:hypothetical protein I4F81_003804 [Pyropia yezoensis]|uniref:Uncharacterized protein n=1 Tax=Pyropia yezoensis TaxID=2788 RepID=A0ACC3BTM2_PYRYE|nr:hypothetical protein I4F81_003804 [Neopyropia yezoensis]